MESSFSNKYESFKQEVTQLILDFPNIGTTLIEGSRNTIKTVELSNGTTINIKFFKKPNVINQFAYRFVRKSKARRSFEYAQYLQERELGTPHPVAFFEDPKSLTFDTSFYVCEHLDYDFMYRDLVSYDQHFENRDDILRQFVNFTYRLHKNDVEFLDHSPGNTLIKKAGDQYNFYIVDLNRMNLGPLTTDDCIKNFAKLTHREDVMKVMATEYARLIDADQKEVYQTMMYYNKFFQYKWHRKEIRKRKIKKLKQKFK
jgi:hypothetical protein